MALRANVIALSARQIRQDLNLSRERMGRLLDVSAKTIERWEDKDALPTGRAQRERLAKMQEIVHLGTTVYRREGLQRFLATPQPEFDGYTALQLIELGHEDKVLAALAADYEGLGH
jgi:transcriptional regulator with XRE-family HTH domain